MNTCFIPNEDQFSKECDLLRWVGEQYGFKEKNESSEEIDGVRQILHSINIRGFLLSEDCTSAVLHMAIPDSDLPTEFVAMGKNSVPVTHTYVGEQWFLVRFGSTAVAFNLEKYRMLTNFHNTVNYHMEAPLEEVRVDPESRCLIFRAGWFSMALAGLRGDGYEEEERAALCSRLEESQPFFEFKAPIPVNWERLIQPKDTTFQNLCQLLLEKVPSVTRVVSVGKTHAADRGRDFDVTEVVHGVLGSKTEKWLVQCKFSNSSVSPDTIKGWTDRVREHGYNGYWLMTNNDITPSLFDQFKDVERNSEMKARLWQRSDFYRKLNVYSELLFSENFFHQIGEV